MGRRGLAVLALAALAVPGARAQDHFPLGPGYEWTYLAFEDLGARGLGFSHKMVRRVLGTRLSRGGTFYWIRESVAEPDVGASAPARLASDLLKLPYKPLRDVADVIYFRDERRVYQKLRAEPPFRADAEFDQKAALFEKDEEPYRLRANAFVPLSPQAGESWEGVATQSKVSGVGPWLSEALRRDYPAAAIVEEEASGAKVRRVFADGLGLVAWFTDAGKAKSYHELIRHRFEPLRAPGQALSEELLEMRLRGLLGPDQEEHTAEDLLLLNRMRQAEREGAADYLKAKDGWLGANVVETKTEGTLRLLLSPKGFERFMFHLSQDTIRSFEKLGFEIKYFTYLVDAADRPLFDERGLLSEEGLEVAYALRRGGRTSFKLPGQDSPPPDLAEALAFLALGHDEIGADGLKFLTEATSCTEAQLREQYSLKSFQRPGAPPRYFLYREDPLMPFIGVHRAGDKAKELMPGGGVLGLGRRKHCK